VLCISGQYQTRPWLSQGHLKRGQAGLRIS
jgi:hypothetical protein